MLFTCTQEKLARAVNLTAHLSGKNATLPILNNILIEADGGILKFTSTNLEIGIKTRIGGRGGRNGKLTVNGRVVSEYINLLKDDKVDLKVENDVLEIKSGNHK